MTGIAATGAQAGPIPQAPPRRDENGGIIPSGASQLIYPEGRPDGWADAFKHHPSDKGWGRYASRNQEYRPQLGDRLPDGRPLAPTDLYLRNAADGAKQLRFSMTTGNFGTGPMEVMLSNLRPDQPSHARRTGQQLIYNRNEPADDRDRRVSDMEGHFQFHRTHNHIHFEDFAKFDLLDANTGKSVVEGKKVSFQITDTDDVRRVRRNSDGSFKDSQRGLVGKIDSYRGQEVQGLGQLSGDTYTAELPGQSLKLTKQLLDTIPNGGSRNFVLRQTFDPSNRIAERNDGNNVVDTSITISKDANGKVAYSQIDASHFAPVSDRIKARDLTRQG